MSKKNKNVPNKQHRPNRKQAQGQEETQSGAIRAQQAGGGWKWMLEDGLGSVRSVLDSNLDVVHTVNYDPYGNPFGSTGTQQTMYGYTGEPVDPNGLVYLRKRSYNTNLGTFISPDPYEGSMNNPMSLNLYAYVQGNPVNRVDPSGMFSVQAINNLMQTNPLALAQMLNAGICNFQQQPCANPPFCTNTPHPTPTPTRTPTFTPTPTPTPTTTPTDSPNVNPCTTRTLFPVFGSCGQECTPHVAGGSYNPPDHRALDLVPEGAYEVEGSSYLNPDWSTRPGPDQYATVYAVTDGTVYGPRYTGLEDAIVLRLSDTWEFVYVHIDPLVTSGFVTAGTPIGVIKPHDQASSTVDVSDEDHLHFGLRNPSRITESRNPASCLRGLVEG